MRLFPEPILTLSRIELRLFLRIAALSFFIYFFLPVARHFLLQSGIYDMGLFTQWSFLITQGGLWEPSSLSDFIKPPLGDHFSLSLIPISLAFGLFPSAYTLIFLQALGLSLAVSLICVDYSRGISFSKIEQAVVILFIVCNPIIINCALNDFHPEVSFSVFAVLSVSCFKRAKYWYALLFAVLFISSKEAMVVFGLGLCIYSLFKRAYLFSAALLFLSLAYFATANHYVSEYLDYAVARYGDLGDSFLAVALSPILRPYAFLLKFFSHDTIQYLSLLVLPLSFLFSSSSIPSLLASSPALLANILSASDVMRQAIYQYQLPVVIFLLYGLVDARPSALIVRRYMRPKSVLLMVVAVGILNLTVNLQLGEFLTRYPRYWPIARDVLQVSQEFSSPEYRIWSHPAIASHFAQRRYIFYSLPTLSRSSEIDIAIFPRPLSSRPPTSFLVKLRNLVFGYGEVDEFSDSDDIASKAADSGLSCKTRRSLVICSSYSP